MYRVKIITVTHNNEEHIQWLLDGLESASENIELKIEFVDSGSHNTEYLDNLVSKHSLIIKKIENIGFVEGNNLALYDIEEYNWVLFLNPDARVEGNNLETLLDYFSKPIFDKVGVITFPLEKYDIKNMKSLNVYDSVGICCDMFGRWKDVRSGETISHTLNNHDYHEVEAICGAFMLIRSNVLMLCKDSKGNIGFDKTYKMYKEDIELSKRISRKGYRNIVFNKYNALHCRGWNSERSKVPYWARKYSAINDIRNALRYKSRATPYAILKYLWVIFFEKR